MNQAIDESECAGSIGEITKLITDILMHNDIGQYVLEKVNAIYLEALESVSGYEKRTNEAFAESVMNIRRIAQNAILAGAAARSDLSKMLSTQEIADVE